MKYGPYISKFLLFVATILFGLAAIGHPTGSLATVPLGLFVLGAALLLA
jgi:hypothetical protein